MLSERLEILLLHLKKYYKFEYGDNIFENFKIKDKTERLLMMLKYLFTDSWTVAAKQRYCF